MGTIVPEMGNVQRYSRNSIGNALFGGVLRRVIGLLFRDPERPYFANEIARIGATGRGALHRELARLTESGLVTMTQSGRQKYYQANKNSPIFQELRSIVVKTFGLSDVIRAALASLTADVALAFIYGSVAKEMDSAASDIDLMVVADSLSYSTVYEALAVTEAELGRKISVSLYTRADFLKRMAEQNHFLASVMEQPRIDLIGGMDDVSDGSTEKPREDWSDQGRAEQPAGD